MTHRSCLRIAAVSTLFLTLGGAACIIPKNVYPTYGVHNSDHSDMCADRSCEYTRGAGEPTDPEYPEYWTSDWKMYRVYGNYENHLPPYDGAPPEGVDYEVSYGTTYYDSTWNGGQGAMMERYEKRCLPIFPIPNDYTCSFISLGENAFFVTYDSDRPAKMPPVCLFSPRNHPPRRDFIKHLPYSKDDGDRSGLPVQGYSFWVDEGTGMPIQTGVHPDRTQDGAIMFGYAFNSQETPDRVDTTAAPYRHPHSFYFSGCLSKPPYAPIVSQYYTNFARVRPDPRTTWDLVSGLDPKTLPECQLFDPPSESNCTLKSGKPAPTWGTIGSKR